MQIFFSQNSSSIQLSAKTYVASTYNEAVFKSEVTKESFSQFYRCK